MVYRENVQSVCRERGAADDTVAHIFSECSKLEQKEYKQVRHDNTAKMLHWKLCEKWGLNKAEKWCIHKPEKVSEYEDRKILWVFPIQTGKTLEHNRPDITVIDKNSKRCPLIDPACPFDTSIKKKEEKRTDYSELKYEIAKIWKMRR